MLADIEQHCKVIGRIHVLGAAPLSACVTLGRVLTRGVHPPLMLYDRIDGHYRQVSTYKKQDHGRKCRCVWLRYAPENGVGCHLDIVPFVTLADGRRVIVNRDINEWEPPFGSTDPQGFTNWVKRRDELTSNQFRRVVRLMKYLRNERHSFDGVKSVILTTLLGLQVTKDSALDPSRYSNLPTRSGSHRRRPRRLAPVGLPGLRALRP